MRWQHVDVAVGEPELDERRGGEEQEPRGGQENHQRPAHDRGRPAAPETQAQLPGGAVGPEQREAQAVDRGAEDRHECRQEGERVDNRDGDDDRARGAHRRQEGALEEEHRGEAHRNRDAGERDRTPGGRHRRGQRIFTGRTVCQLVAEAIDHEQRVIDGDAEADEGDDVEGVLRDVREPVEEERAGETADDRENADAKREAGGHERSKDDDQQDERDREGHELGALKVAFEGLVESLVDGDEPGPGHRQRVRMDLVSQRVVVVVRLGPR